MPELTIYCCGQLMTCAQWDADQEETFAGFECEVCGASFYGKLKPGNKEEEDAPQLKGVKDGR